MDQDLSRSDWLKAARLALLQGGVDAVRVERLARNLQVTKGSFYWHFKDREQLLEALLREWEEEKQLVFDLLGQRDLRRALTDFFRELERRVMVSERGEWPSDAAIFAWAAVSPKVARRANKEEKERIRLLKRLFRHKEISPSTSTWPISAFFFAADVFQKPLRTFRFWPKSPQPFC